MRRMPMKPIKLTIKGLNSFIEEQTIDFEKLTDCGLFGIFGPTGSGKSTVLDGITLALYGDIARKSSNYINTNCNDLNVSYEFQISGVEDQIYKVSRHFKRDKNTGNAKTHSASVVKYTEEGPKVLAEGATQVTKTCKEILGLSLEDFTRTVVLPQGKFSEFLKLEGKSRREMLERLFNLQEYGDRLTRKLSREITKERAHDNQILGELKGYEEISEDKLREGKKQLEEESAKLNELQKEQERLEESYKKSEEVWQLQKEMAAYHSRQKELAEGEKEIKKAEEKVRFGESALRIHPTLMAYEGTTKNIEVEEKHARSLEEMTKKLSEEKVLVEESFKVASMQKEEKLPQLKESCRQLEEVQEDQVAAVVVETEILKTQSGLMSLAEHMKGFYGQQKQVEEALQKYSERMISLQKEEEGLKVDEKMRTTVQQGLMTSQHFELEKNKLTKNTERIKAIQAEEVELEKALQLHEKALEEVRAKVTKGEEEAEKLKKPPYTQEELMKKQEEAVSLKEKWNRYQKLQLDMAACQEEIEVYAKEEAEAKKGYEMQQKKVQTAKEAFEKAQVENMAVLLRGHLHQGDHCPVCGGMVYQSSTVETKVQEALAHFEVIYQEEQNGLEELVRGLNKVQLLLTTKKDTFIKLEEEVKPLADIFSGTSIQKAEEELNGCTLAMKQYEEQKSNVESALAKLKDEKNNIEKSIAKQMASFKEKKSQMVILEKEMGEEKVVLERLQGELESLKKLVEGKDFALISEEIKTKDKKREEVTNEINEVLALKDEKLKEKEIIQGKISKYKANFQKGLAQFDEKQKAKMTLLVRMGNKLSEILASKEVGEELRQGQALLLTHLKGNNLLLQQLKGQISYQSILGEAERVEEYEKELSTLDLEENFNKFPLIGESLVSLKDKLEQLITIQRQVIIQIEETYTRIQKRQQEITEQYDQVSKQLIEVQAKLVELKKRAQDEKELLQKALEEEHMTIEEVRSYLLTKEVLEQLKKVISDHKEECSKLLGAMEQTKVKLAGRKLEENEWLAMQAAREKLLEEVKMQNEICIRLSTDVKNMETALEKLGKLREEKEKLDHKLAILSDLDKLFKGKRFVEYVASTRLKYISIEASKKLQEISCGNYGLEVDEDGRFIIRDYKNGGAQRDASTLSGGETFLASLALALALSAEIQLKGTAPLELFFLDEGFGTLDDDLLETVMSSLERIHHEKLKIGIISHVEAIKNRMPVKLILSPAEAGMGGTKIRMERS